MSFRSIVRDMREGIGTLSRRSVDAIAGNQTGTFNESNGEFYESSAAVQTSQWADFLPDLLRDVIMRLEASETTWPSRKTLIACAGVCRSWREICKEIVKSPECTGKITFPLSLKQPGYRDSTMQCFIKRDKSKLTYHLFLCLSPALLVENGKFLLSAKRTRRTSCTEYIISMDAENISRSSNAYIGKLRSNFLGTKFIIYDTQPPYNNAQPSSPSRSRRFYAKKVAPKVPAGNYSVAQISYELNVLGTRGPRRMLCTMHSVPASSLEPGGNVPEHPDILPRPAGDSFRSVSFSKSLYSSRDFSSGRLSECCAEDEGKQRPLILRNKAPRWHDQLQCWCLNFRGRVTVASVKNFQLIAGAPTPVQPGQPADHDKIILQFGKVGKDMFTMDYRYPLSAFQAFAICLSSFDTKLACE